MFCPSCGIALTHPMKYCNRCGTRLETEARASEIDAAEKRLREELVDLFWVTVFGCVLILGGLAVIQKGLHLDDWILIAYLILSSAAFAVNFALSLWQIRRLAKIVEEARAVPLPKRLDTNEIGPANTPALLDEAPSVTEHTTKTLEPVPRERAGR